MGNPERVNKGYGWAKRFLEQKATLLAEETDIPVTIVRPFNIYGERYRWVGEYSQAIPMLVKRIMDGENPVEVWGSGDQRRSYIHAQDCARMMMGLVEKGYSAGPVNIGTQETWSMRDLVALICEVAKADPEISFNRSKPEGRLVKSSDTALFNATLPQFQFEVPLREGLMRMLKWYDKTFRGESIE
jgi:nucleoside-diphosphate-sugar epimerase